MLFEYMFRLDSSRASDRFKLPTLVRVIADEEVLDLPNDGISKIADLFDVDVVQRLDGNRQQPVVSERTVLIRLLGLDRADYSGDYQQTGEQLVVGQQQHVQRVAVLARSRREKPEVVRKLRAGRQHLVQREQPCLGIEL